MQISAGVVLAGDVEAAEPLAGTPHSPPPPHAGLVAAWRHRKLEGPVPPGWGSLEPWSSVSILHAFPFPWPRCNRAAAPWPPPGSLFQSERPAGRGGGGEVGDYKAPWHLAGPILRHRNRAPGHAPLGRAEGLTCQESELQRPRPSFLRLFGTLEP